MSIPGKDNGFDIKGLAVDGRRLQWLVLYDAPGADRKEGEHTVFGDLLRRD